MGVGHVKRCESLVARTSTRALFAGLVGSALEGIGLCPSPMATAYLIELLDGQVRSPDCTGGRPPARALAESLIAARRAEAISRIETLRELGDRALFVAGFFGDSLRRGLMGRSYYGEIGRGAYAALAASLAVTPREDSWPQLFEELADCFAEFSEVLAEVGDHACPRKPEDLQRLYARYLETGSVWTRRRLLRLGCFLPPLATTECWQ